MKITTKGHYGLRIMMELAFAWGTGPVLVDNIAKNQGISGKYIHVLMLSLKNTGLARAVRGPNGGYLLTRAPAEITISEIIHAMEGSNFPVDCVGDKTQCSRSHNCAASELWTRIYRETEKILAAVTLQDLIDRQRALLEPQVEYQI
jgi:Rrf2 family protein